MARYSQDWGPNWWNETESVMKVARNITDEGNSTAQVVHSRQYTWDSGSGTWIKGVASGGGGGGGDGAILDGVSASIKATVFDYTNSNPIAARLTDLNGDYVSVGGGTQYVEDAAPPADPTGTALMGRRRDSLATETTTDGDWTTANVTAKGEQYVKHVDAVPVSYSSGTFPVSGPLTDAQLRASAVPVSGTFFQATQPVSGTVTANQGGAPWSTTISGAVDTELPAAAAISADNQSAPTAPSVYGFNMTWDGSAWDRQPTPLTDTQLRATPVPVSGTVTANAGTGPFPVSDNAGSLTVDAPVATPVAARLSDGTAFLTTTGGRLSVDASGVAVPITDNAGSLTVDDGGGSLTVDGSVTALDEDSATGTHANFTGSGASQTIIASNASRKGATVYNDSGVVCYVKLAATASSTSFTVKMVDQSYFEVPFKYTGIIDALWASGSVRVVELT